MVAKATVLVIIYRSERFVTVHESASAARDALRAFIDRNLCFHDSHGVCSAAGTQYNVCTKPADESKDCTADQFFDSDGDLYLIAEADLSEIEAALNQYNS